MFTLCTFGGFQTHVNGIFERSDIGIPGRKLLIFLLLNNGRAIRKEKLVDLLYGDRDYDKSALALNTNIWRLKKWNNKYLKHFDSKVISLRGEIAMEVMDTSFFDRDEFERYAEITENPGAEQIPRLRQAAEIYRGPFMEGEDDSWILVERERLHCQHIRALEFIMTDSARAGQYGDALSCGRRILREDPLREDVHRHMMRLYAASGQRAAALSQFNQCRNVMLEECGLAPLPETFELLDQVRKGLS